MSSSPEQHSEVVDVSEKPNSPSETDKEIQDKDKETSDSETNPNPWQAIWSPQHNAYYFYKATTNETTWVNPLQSEQPSSLNPPPSTQEPPSAPLAESAQPIASSSTQPQYSTAQQAALAQGIDPSLAYLDPSLGTSGGAPGVPGVAPSFTAKFNARTGRFTATDGRDPEHMSEYERARRMSEFYFDVNAWQQDVDHRYQQGDTSGTDEAGKKRKRPTKKDLERFAQRKKERKLAKTAWLRT